MSEAAKWYIVHTYSGYENKVAETIQKVVENRNLQELILAVCSPTEIVKEKKKVKDRKTGQEHEEEHEVETKIFPGYVMIKMVLNDDTWVAVRNVRGVTGFVGPGSKPTPLSDAEVKKMGLESDTVQIAAAQVQFKIGDTVRISSGTMEGFSGKVTSIDSEAGTVEVIVSMFGRETPTVLEIGQVSVLSED